MNHPFADSKTRTNSNKPKSKPLRRARTILSPLEPLTAKGEDLFRLHDLEINEARIHSILDSHHCFKVRDGFEIRNLPKFDDLERYDISEAREMELWKLEVHRLATSVTSQQPPSLEGPSEWYGDADRDGYNRLHTLAVALGFGLDICAHDNELVMLEHLPQLANVNRYSAARRRLTGNFDVDEGIIRYDRVIKLQTHHDEAYHALVNYITASIARVLSRTMKGEFWIENCLSTVAKFAAKLKVVDADLPRAVSTTFQAQKDFQMRVSQQARTRGTSQNIPSSNTSRGEDNDDPFAKQQKALRTDFDMSGARYYFVVASFHHGIGRMLDLATADLKWNEDFVQTAEVFETSAVIYNTCFLGERTQLCQERDGAIGAAADRDTIRCAGVAFDICREIWCQLPSSAPPLVPHTCLDWTWTELTPSGDLALSTSGSNKFAAMKDVISALVPYLMYCGGSPGILSNLARTAILNSDPTHPVKYYSQSDYLAAARIRTSQYQESRSVDLRKIQFQNVYDTIMAQEGALAAVRGHGDDDWSQTHRQRHTATIQKFREALTEVDKWIIDERSIIITSVWYSWFVLATVGMLVAGGVALLAVENRISGVDPSNITVLIWTAAGFLVIYFKSMRVENWPWRDFLRGRVVCRSVTEVQAVTKIDPQLLIAILMRYEARTFLKKRGPFNGLFDRKSEDGFSIDVPPLVKTAIDGGHIFIRVDSLSGPALVGLEAKHWDEYESISPIDQREKGAGYGSRYLQDPSHRLLDRKGDKEQEKIEGSSLPLYPISTNEQQWRGVQGVFVEEALFT